jgi:putative ABC transport system permease protein
MTDLRSAFRSLKATPLVTTVAILSLALGIGANTAIFSIVDALILKSLPVEHAQRLVMLQEGESRRHWTNPIWEQVRDRPELFDGAFAVGSVRFNAAQRGQVDPIDGAFASGRYFEVLGVQPRLGRFFTAADDKRGGGPDGAVAVISYGLWQSRFGGATDVIGRTFELSRVAYTIIGVAPQSFFGHEVGRTIDVYVPIGTEPLVRGRDSALDRRSTWWMPIFVRLRPDQSVDQAIAALRLAQPGIREATLPEQWRPQDQAQYLADPLTLVAGNGGISNLRTRYSRPLWALTAVVALTLLIACGNIANLMLARASARRHEFAVRTALGASRWRLARQLLGENLLLSAMGAALGTLFAVWGSRLIISQIGTTNNRVFLDVGIDPRMLGFTALIAITVTLLFGIAPTLLASKVPPMDAMKEQGRGTPGGRLTFAGALVFAQVSLSLVLLVAAGLFVRTFAELARVELGFTPERVMVANVGAARSGLEPVARKDLYDRVTESLKAVPGVSHVARSVITPVSGSTWNDNLEFPEKPDLPEADRNVDFNYVAPGWFDAIGTRIIRGRDFDARDRFGAPEVALVNQAFARKYFDGADPIGKVVRTVPNPNEAVVSIEIIGLTADAAYRNLREEMGPVMYRTVNQQSTAEAGATFTIRTSTAEPAALTQALTSAVAETNPELTVTFRTLEDFVDASLTQERLIAMLSGFFGILALILAALGLYGVTAYTVIRRRGELGIRMALGASPRAVVAMILSRTGVIVLGGIAVGGLVSWWASRFVSTLLFGLTPTDPLTIVGAMVTLVGVAAIAGWLPARRAARIDPAEVLRES